MISLFQNVFPSSQGSATNPPFLLSVVRPWEHAEHLCELTERLPFHLSLEWSTCPLLLPSPEVSLCCFSSRTVGHRAPRMHSCVFLAQIPTSSRFTLPSLFFFLNTYNAPFLAINLVFLVYSKIVCTYWMLALCVLSRSRLMNSVQGLASLSTPATFRYRV